MNANQNQTRSDIIRIRRNVMRRWGFRLAAVILSLLLLAGVEISLRFTDAGGLREDEDPQLGFSSIHPLFKYEADGTVYRTTASRQIYFGTQEFPAEKAEGDFRVFVLGGSTVRGRPYQTETAFAHWLQFELQGREPDRAVQCINCGGLSYASYRLYPILREVLGYKPDLIVIATGHNEFLEDRTFQAFKSRSATEGWVEDHLFSLRMVKLTRRLFTPGLRVEQGGRAENRLLPAEVDARLDDAGGYASYQRDPEWQRNVIAQFEGSLSRMIKECNARRVPVLLVKLGTNIRDCPPFKSQHRDDLGVEDERLWRDLFDQASNQQAEDPAKALELYLQANELDSEHALLAYRIAVTLDQLGRSNEASDWYITARDLDVCPLRKTTLLNDALMKVADTTGVPLVDSERMVCEQSPDGIPGFELFVDHVHPSISGHQLMASQIAEQCEELGLVGSNEDWDGQRRPVYRDYFQGLPANYLANGRRRVGWLENWAQRHRLADELVPRTARSFLAQGHRLAEFGDFPGAWSMYESALDQDSVMAIPALLDRTLQWIEQGRSLVVGELLVRLELRELSQQQKDEVSLGLLVVAQELDDQETAAGLLLDSGTAIQRAIAAGSRWSALLLPEWGP